jgi:hypothetical protein
MMSNNIRQKQSDIFHKGSSWLVTFFETLTELSLLSPSRLMTCQFLSPFMEQLFKGVVCDHPYNQLYLFGRTILT